jgi:hypothetical protein
MGSGFSISSDGPATPNKITFGRIDIFRKSFWDLLNECSNFYDNA